MSILRMICWAYFGTTWMLRLLMTRGINQPPHQSKDCSTLGHHFIPYSLTDFDEIPSLQVGTIFCTKTFLQTLFLHMFACYIPSLLFFFYWNSILRRLTMFLERRDLSLHWWCCSVGAMHLGADGSSLDQSGRRFWDQISRHISRIGIWAIKIGI